MDFDAAEVKAAGGVVWRAGDPPEIVIVHRQRYDDWSLPKGKLDPGEGWEEAALREVEEEVGLRCRLGRELPATNYRDKRIFLVLLLVYFLNLFLFALLILCFFYPFLFSFWLMFLLTKALLEMPFMYKVSSFFSLQKLMLWFVLMQPVHIIYTVISGWLGKFGSYRWKGRKVK